MTRKLIAYLIIFASTACSMINEPPRLYSGMEGKAPAGTPMFRGAWQDGCETGLKVSGNTHFKVVHAFRFNADYIENDEYNEGWYLGFDYCRWRVGSWQRKGGA